MESGVATGHTHADVEPKDGEKGTEEKRRKKKKVKSKHKKRPKSKVKAGARDDEQGV